MISLLLAMAALPSSDLVYAAGRCHAHIAIEHRVLLEAAIRKAPPYQSGFLQAIYDGGKAHSRKEMPSRQTCADVLERLANA